MNTEIKTKRRYLSTTEVAEILGVTSQGVDKMRNKKRIPKVLWRRSSPIGHIKFYKEPFLLWDKTNNTNNTNI